MMPYEFPSDMHGASIDRDIQQVHHDDKTDRLRASHAALLAAAKYTVAVLDGKKPKDFEPDQPFDLVTLKYAIARAEEPAP